MATTYTLTVTSQNPNSGVTITVSPSGSCTSPVTTPETCTFDDGTDVTLTAPQTANNGNSFVEWRLDGSPETTNCR